MPVLPRGRRCEPNVKPELLAGCCSDSPPKPLSGLQDKPDLNGYHTGSHVDRIPQDVKDPGSGYTLAALDSTEHA